MYMKRKCLPIAAVLTGLLAGCICGCSGQTDNSISTQNSTAAGNVADGDVAVNLSTESQLTLIAENKSVWYVEPSEEWICYLGISDFDDNGRLEITISREEAGSYVNTQFYMYEVNEDGAGLTKINVELKDAERMPDISLNSVLDCYKAGDGSLYYAVTDCNMSDYSTYEYDNYMIKLENGTLDCNRFSSMEVNLADDNNPERYFDAADNPIEAKSYNDSAEECVKAVCGTDYELYKQILGFHYYEQASDIEELIKLSYEKARRMSSFEYEEYVTAQYDSNSSASLGLDEIGALYYTDIDENYLKNKRWTSFYVSNFETGVESDYINNGGEGSRFEKEMIFFANDGTGYYVNPNGEVVNFTWSINDVGSAEAVAEGDTYRNSIFGYTLIDNDGLEHPTIAFEYKNEYIYSMCE